MSTVPVTFPQADQATYAVTRRDQRGEQRWLAADEEAAVRWAAAQRAANPRAQVSYFRLVRTCP